MADSTLLTLSAVLIAVALLVCIWGLLVMGGGIQRGPSKGHRIIPPTLKPSERARPQSPQPDPITSVKVWQITVALHRKFPEVDVQTIHNIVTDTLLIADGKIDPEAYRWNP